MEMFWGCMAICATLILIAWDQEQGLIKELKRIRRELQKLNGKQIGTTSTHEPEAIQLLPGACFRHVAELRYLVNNREVSDELLDHVDACKDCRGAVDRVMNEQET